MLTNAARFVVRAGVAVIVTRPGAAPRIESLTTAVFFDSWPVLSGEWVTFTAADGVTVRTLARHARSVTPERHRLDTHGWRDGEDD